MTHKMSKKKVSIIGIILTFLMTFTLLGGTKTSYENIKKGLMNLFAANEDGTPKREKMLINNNDGTYKLSLSVTGDSEKKFTKANVIVIMDVSGSMNTNAPNSQQTRLTAAKNAVNSLANSLLSNNGKNGNPNDIFEMAFVSFSTKATTRISKTTSYDTFSASVNSLSADGGTNWEDALQNAKSINFDNDGDPTYVIFVSDGNPTFRNTKGNYTNMDDYWYNGRWNGGTYVSGVYGNGSDSQSYGGIPVNTTITRCYDH